MFIPLGTDRPLRRPTLVNYWLLALNTVLFMVQVVIERLSPADAERYFDAVMLVPGDLKPWTFITYQFAHADWLHLLGNMAVLWVFGANVEDRFGRIGYGAFYLLGGVIAGLLHVLFEDAPVIGASGSIAAVTGAYLVLFPRTMIRCLVFFFIIGMYWIPAWWFIGFAIFKDMLLAGFSDGVARLAHLGGYGFGAIVSAGLLATRTLAREPYDLFTIGRQAYRRRQFKEAGVRRDEEVARRLDARRSAAASARSDEIARARAEVTTPLAVGDMDAAAAAYRRLADAYGDQPGAVVFSRRHMHDLATHMHLSQKHADAAFAFERFLEAYPKDSEAPQVRLMLAIINARFLNDPVRAKQLLANLEGDLHDDGLKEQARKLVHELA